MKIFFLLSLPLVLLTAVFSGSPALAESGQAVAVLIPTENHNVRGTVWFTPAAGGTDISIQLSGLDPGPHAIHIHEYGDCTSPDAESAGPHFNPGGMQHGAPGDAERHAGDLGNIVADDKGNAAVHILDPVIKLEGPNAVIGRAAIVHKRADDFKSQPAGAAGERLACGVVGRAKSK